MQVSVFVGKTYALRSMAGGVLANEKGETLETLEPGQQLHVTALEPVWVLPDDCQMAMVNFKQAARELGLLAGGKSGLPAGYTRVEFLESTGTQYIDTDFHSENMRSISVKVQKTVAIGQLMMTIAAFVPKELTQAYGIGDGSVHNKTTYSSCWNDGLRYCAVEHTNPVILYKDATYGITTVDGVSVSTTAYGWYNLTNDKFLNAHPLRLFANIPQNNRTKTCSYIRMWWAKAESAEGSAEFIPVIDSAGTPCMYDKVSKQPFQNSGSGAFIAGCTMSQASQLGKLPATGGSLTISLPKEARLVQHNQRVESALATATEKGWNISVQYREEFEDESILNKYAECVTDIDIRAVNVKRASDLTEENEWIYPLPKLKRIENAGLFAESPMVSFNSELPELEEGTYMFYRAIRLKEWNKDLPKLTSAVYMFEQTASLKRFSGNLPSLTNWNKIFWNAIALTDFDCDVSMCSSGDNMFRGTKLNKTSALRVLNGIPRWTSGTHKLTIGIHIDHQNDEEVLAAIALADIAQTPIEEGGKGWTMTIQWNGTPTAQSASTFGLRKPPIYAKLDTAERPDGTVENFLDWGHYVSNAEENGYQEFASIEEAEEHFNIKKEIEE